MKTIRSFGRRVRDGVRPGPPGAGAAATNGLAERLLTAEEAGYVAEVRPFTMTSDERLVANMDAVTYVVERGIPGAIVECGVWRGGSMVMMIRTLQRLGVEDRPVYLYDTFEGMTEPTDADTSQFEEPALAEWEKVKGTGETPWGFVFGAEAFNLNQVQELVYSTGYPRDLIHFVVGAVEATIPKTIPDGIAVLRLDTDWYESTRHELHHLYPRLADSGVLILDDYGHWEGARRAVDEYFATDAKPLLLGRIDYTGRMGVKQ